VTSRLGTGNLRTFFYGVCPGDGYGGGGGHGGGYGGGPQATDIPPHVLLVNDCWCAQGTGTEVEAIVEDMEEDPLTTDYPPHVLFVDDCCCAQGMGTEEVEATVEDMEEDPLATDPHA
jgi:hypothetical protein